MNWLTFPTPEETAHSLLDVSGAAGLGLLLASGGCGCCTEPGTSIGPIWLATWAFTPFVVALLISIARPIFLDRYLIVASPAFALLGAIAILGVGHGTGGARRRGRCTWASASGSGTRRTRAPAGRTGGTRSTRCSGAGRRRRGRRRPLAAHAAAEYYGARPVDVSTAGLAVGARLVRDEAARRREGGAPRPRLRRSRARREAAVRAAPERAALATAARPRGRGSGRACGARADRRGRGELLAGLAGAGHGTRSAPVDALAGPENARGDLGLDREATLLQGDERKSSVCMAL